VQKCDLAANRSIRAGVLSEVDVYEVAAASVMNEALLAAERANTFLYTRVDQIAPGSAKAVKPTAETSANQRPQPPITKNLFPAPIPTRSVGLAGLQTMEPLWSPWLQQVAMGRESDGPKNRRNTRKPLPVAATRCRRQAQVRRGRRLESVRGLYKSPAKRGFFFRVHLLGTQRAVGIEPFMELRVEKCLLSARKPATLGATTQLEPRRLCADLWVQKLRFAPSPIKEPCPRRCATSAWHPAPAPNAPFVCGSLSRFRAFHC
jgi:hypothetical protein